MHQKILLIDIKIYNNYYNSLVDQLDKTLAYGYSMNSTSFGKKMKKQ